MCFGHLATTHRRETPSGFSTPHLSEAIIYRMLDRDMWNRTEPPVRVRRLNNVPDPFFISCRV